MPERLVLSSGPKLTYWPAPETSVDVTNTAHQYLFEALRVENSATFGDLIRLLRTSPLLAELFVRRHALEFLAELDAPTSTVANVADGGNALTLRISFSERGAHSQAGCLEFRLVEPETAAQVRDIEAADLREIAGCPLQIHRSANDHFELTLGALLDAALQSLSFFGSPFDVTTLADEIHKQTFGVAVDAEVVLRELRSLGERRSD